MLEILIGNLFITEQKWLIVYSLKPDDTFVLMSKKPVREVTLDELTLYHIGNAEMCLICEVGVWINPVQTDWSMCVILGCTQNRDVSLRRTEVKINVSVCKNRI